MRVFLLAGIASLAACQSSLDDSPELVTAPRIIAVAAEPAEVVPGAALTLTGFVATPDGPAEPALEWAFCNLAKPLGENNIVAPGCVSGNLSAAGPPGISVATTMPTTACQLFGPEIPPQVSGEPPQRPRDPDGTGGYYQPVRVTLGDDVAFSLVRVRCRLAMAPFDVAQQFEASYQNNQNPTIDTLTATDSGSLVATWSTTADETYVRFDAASQALVNQSEVLSATWFATDRLGAPAATTAGSQVFVTNPRSGDLVHAWVVLHDDRGGVAVQELDWTAP